MNREQAINYLFSCGFTNEQVCDVVRALTYEPTTKNDSSELEKNSKKLEEPQTFKWCTDCREYDQEKHCCHRWSKVIRNTVAEMKQEQEPILDKLKAEIESTMKYQYAIGENQYAEGFEKSLEIIDKYKAESEGK